MIFNIPQAEDIEINTIVLDLNGTLAVYGEITKETKNLIQKLKKLQYRLVLISGDIRGQAKEIADALGLEFF